MSRCMDTATPRKHIVPFKVARCSIFECDTSLTVPMLKSHAEDVKGVEKAKKQFSKKKKRFNREEQVQWVDSFV